MPAAGVGDGDPAGIPVRLKGNLQRPALRHGFDAIEEQIDKHLMELLGIAVDHDRRVGVAFGNRDILLSGAPSTRFKARWTVVRKS